MGLMLAIALATKTLTRSLSLIFPWLPIERQLNGRRNCCDVGKNSTYRLSERNIRTASAEMQGGSRGLEAIFRSESNHV
ncbi:MAG: hypothetical protein QOF42_190 [Gammaproteobacteria bacterium]|nr:hypothetical protein [Gammaproteobacteria bacterium]